MSKLDYYGGISPREQVYLLCVFAEHVRQKLTQAALDSIRPSVEEEVALVMKDIMPTLRNKLGELNSNLIDSIIADYESNKSRGDK